MLDGPDRAEAMDLIRSMIERVDITPRADGSGVDAVLHGDLAAILAACGEAGSKRKQPAVYNGGLQVTLVAGARNHRELPLRCSISPARSTELNGALSVALRWRCRVSRRYRWHSQGLVKFSTCRPI